MPMRLKLLGTLFVLVVLLAQEKGLDLFATWHAAAGILGMLTVFSAIALWPSSDANETADRNVARGAWADGIDFDKIAAKRSQRS